MERYRDLRDVSIFMMFLYAYSFIRQLLLFEGIRLSQGLILVTDNDLMTKRLVKEYCGMPSGNGIMIRTWKSRTIWPENYEVGFVQLNRGMTLTAVDDFLNVEGFTPVITLGGILPEGLRSDRYIFRVTGHNVWDIRNPDFLQFTSDFQVFAVNHANDLCGKLRTRSKENVFDVYRYSQPELCEVLEAVGFFLFEFMRDIDCEKNALDFYRNYRDHAVRWLETMADFAGESEVIGQFCEALTTYLVNHPKISFSERSHVDGVLSDAIKNNQIILYDSEYYFLTNEMLLEICSPLLSTLSVPALKGMLAEAGVLRRCSADYTAKVGCVDSYGNHERPRMLWLMRANLSFDPPLEIAFGSTADRCTDDSCTYKEQDD